MASNLRAMASSLRAMADGLQLKSDGLQPESESCHMIKLLTSEHAWDGAMWTG